MGGQQLRPQRGSGGTQPGDELRKGQGDRKVENRLVEIMRRLRDDLGDREGDEPVVVFARDLHVVLPMLRTLGEDEMKTGDLNW